VKLLSDFKTFSVSLIIGPEAVSLALENYKEGNILPQKHTLKAFILI